MSFGWWVTGREGGDERREEKEKNGVSSLGPVHVQLVGDVALGFGAVLSSA
jgi:hypothetical protein